jgi:hypothetical protein
MDNLTEYTNMVPPEFHHLHRDFNKVFNYVKIRYIRNVLRWNYDFSKSRLFMTKFDYKYSNENDCIPNFKKMQSEGRYFIAKYKDKDWNFQLENKYIKYLVASIREIITNLIVPISRVPEEIYSIVEKYRNNEDLYGPQFDESSDDENDMNDMNDENDEV